VTVSALHVLPIFDSRDYDSVGAVVEVLGFNWFASESTYRRDLGQ
jgi:hypothetical protein